MPIIASPTYDQGDYSMEPEPQAECLAPLTRRFFEWVVTFKKGGPASYHWSYRSFPPLWQTLWQRTAQSGFLEECHCAKVSKAQQTGSPGRGLNRFRAYPMGERQSISCGTSPIVWNSKRTLRLPDDSLSDRGAST